LKVLIACEYSGAVRQAFRNKGHDAYSCDIIPSDDNSPYHWQETVEWVLSYEPDWDLIIAFPPCTHLCVSGARWFKDKIPEQKKALDFVKMLMDVPCDKIAIENPIGVISTKIRKPDQIIQPWQFGHGETKATCLWLKGLPKLTPTNIVEGREPRIHKMPPSKNRGKERSRTYQGIAQAMANQWG
jgi:site-specific DNA-cytosine methylase